MTRAYLRNSDLYKLSKRKNYGRPYICQQCGAEVYWRRTEVGGETAPKQKNNSIKLFGKALCSRCQSAECGRRLEQLRPGAGPVYVDTEGQQWFVAPTVTASIDFDGWFAVYSYTPGATKPQFTSECPTEAGALDSLRRKADHQGMTVTESAA